MSQEIDNSAELTNNAIVFDCEHCGKSLEIDVRGAGLSISCPECGGDVDVPIPKGVELADIDNEIDTSTEENDDETSDLINIDQKTNALMTEIEELRFRTQFLEKKWSQHKKATQSLTEHSKTIRSSLKAMDDILESLLEKNSNDTQEMG